MTALYELAQMRPIIDRWVDEYDGEWTPEIAELFDGLDMEVDVKIERTGLAVRERKAYIEMVKIERERLDAMIKRSQRVVENLLAYLQYNMQVLNKVSVKGKLCTVAIQKNAVPTITCTVEMQGLPAELRKETLTYSLDREQILKRWQDHALPDGIQVEQGTHVRIR